MPPPSLRLLPVLPLLLVALPLAAQGNPRVEPHRAAIDSIFAPYAGPGSPGCAVAVVAGDGEPWTAGYGTASLEHGVPITPRTAFYAASVSKQFTAFVVALLADRGLLSLDDDVRRWIPEVPDFGPTITVRHLVHHTSGLRDYFGLLGLTGWQDDGPLTEPAFLDLVSRQRGLNFAPGTQYRYSNTGYVLMAVLVQRVTGRSLREVAEAEIFRPLGMGATGFRDDRAMLVENRALAYEPTREGGYRFSMPGFDVVGDGGLYTTVEDLARWARALDARAIGGPRVAETFLTRGRLGDGSEIAYAFGVSHGEYRGQAVVQHGGSYGGYQTYLVQFPAERAAVATLCNTAAADPTALSERVADRLLAGSLGPAADPAAAGPASAFRMAPEELAGYVGAYWNERSQLLRRFALRDGALAGLAAGGQWFPLVPVAAGGFRLAAPPRAFRFADGPDGAPRMEETDPAGRITEYRRMPPPGPVPTDVAGLYRSEELDADWRLEASGAGLVLRRRGAGELTLEPVFPDAFASPAGVLRLERDAAGRVTGFTLSAGRVTGLRFERVAPR
jgi:YD repeat-containing protein